MNSTRHHGGTRHGRRPRHFADASGLSVHFVIGHSREGGLPKDMDRRAIADPSATTIFYMGGRTADKIAARLIAEGLAPESPAAIAIDLGRPSQRGARLQTSPVLAKPSARSQLAPSLIGIGRAFGRRGMWQINGLRSIGQSQAGVSPSQQPLGEAVTNSTQATPRISGRSKVLLKETWQELSRIIPLLPANRLVLPPRAPPWHKPGMQ
jgi:hypothetical protein